MTQIIIAIEKYTVIFQVFKILHSFTMIHWHSFINSDTVIPLSYY